MSNETPKFVVVGHPNRGKSSIVSTLVQNSEVPIDADPGTTIRSGAFKIKVDDQLLFELIDTPGFQRPRTVFKWLMDKAQGTDSHPYTVRQFVLQKENREKFPDEVEILKPIIEGAGILYVVDGSIPYGPEYDSELEILRWTGQPRMALINPIGEADHIESWKQALGQFFSVVKVFDAHKATFDQQLELLQAFSHLNDKWKVSLQEATKLMNLERDMRVQRATSLVAKMLVDMLSLKLEKSLSENVIMDDMEKKLESSFKSELVNIESICRRNVEEVFNHLSIDRREITFELPELFSEESLRIFGLKKSELLKYGAISGAAVGGVVDVATGGSSLFMGGLVGGLCGAGTAFFAADKVATAKIVFNPLGRKVLQIGPITDISFPHMVLERARTHLVEILRRNHSNREHLDLDASLGSLPPISQKVKRNLEKEFSRLRKNPDPTRAIPKLEILVENALKEGTTVNPRLANGENENVS